MKRNKLPEGIIMRMLIEQQQGRSVTELCYKYSISTSTFYKWKQYAELLHKIKDLQNEVARYKTLATAQAHVICQMSTPPARI